jgi:hypothetical protein
MKTKQLIFTVALLTCLSTLNPQLSTVFAQGTAFTYQGRLNDTGQPATGIYDLRFTIYDSAGGGNVVAGPLTNSAAGVTNGLFTVTLDFGDGVFTGDARWLEIAARTNGSGAFTTLLPLQPITPTPYAIMANTASNLLGTLPAAQLSGTVANGQPASNLTVNGTVTAASFAGSGAALTGVTPADGSVTSAKLAAGAVSNVNIAAGAVGNTKLANSAVTVAAGTGLSGGGAVSLGGSVTLHNAGVVSLTGGGGVTVSASSGAVTLGCTATDTNIPNAIVRRDTEGSFAARTISLSKNLSLSGNLSLPATSLPSNGVVFVNGIPFLHSYNYGNTFVGLNAGNLAMYGFANTATGFEALKQNTWGDFNTANGYQALSNNLIGQYNTATGAGALQSNTNGQYNTAIGEETLDSNTTGHGNIALGYYAGHMITTGFDNIDIGNAGQASDSSTIRIGFNPAQTNTFIAGIFDSVVATRAVCVDSSGHLGTAASSRRFKEAIEDVGDQSDVLLSLRPVSFRYKPEIDPQGIPQFGLIAEEVEQVAPALVMRDAKGAVHSVRYESVNAMLLNEFLKEHRKVEQFESRLEKLEQLLSAKNGGAQ